jgi:hypothetical protein
VLAVPVPAVPDLTANHPKVITMIIFTLVM